MRTILVVDDSAYVRRMIRFALAQKSYRILEASDGADALQCLLGNRIDLLITDLAMPNMSGFELIRLVRDRKEYEFLPIILLTADSDESCRTRARRSGVSAFIAKPFVPDQISGLVDGIF